jgi:Rieske Fe-S protein
MTRRGRRAFFVTGALATALLGAVAVSATLASRPYVLNEGVVAIASLEALPQGAPVLVTVKELAGLEREAGRVRWQFFGGTRVNTSTELPVYLVRDGAEVHGFIAVDPRNGCLIEVRFGLFHDVCHSSLYNFAGQKVGGPSPYAMDQLVVTIRDGRIYADVRKVTPGRVLMR